MEFGISPRSRSTLRQVLVALTVGLGNFGISATMGFTASALTKMHKDPTISISEEQGSWIASVLPASAIAGCLWASYLLDAKGRKYVLVLSVLNFMITWIGIGIATNALILIFLRFYAGICLGLQSTAGAVYYAEMIESEHKASFGIFTAVLGTLGNFFISYVAIFFDWRGVAFLGGLLCLPQLFCLYFLPESPNFLYCCGDKKGKMAFETLLWLLPSLADAKLALIKMKQSYLQLEHTTVSSKDLWEPSNRWPISVLFLLHILQQTTAINIFIFFSATIFSKVDGITSPESCTMTIAAVNVVSNLLSVIFQSTCPRRKLLKFSSVFVISSLWTISLYFFLKEYLNTFEDAKYLSGIFLLTAVVYIIAFAIGWGPVPFLFISEGLPSNIRGKVSGIALALNWGMTFLVTKTFLWMSEITGYGFVFLLYSILTTFGTIVMEIYLPETFRLTSHEIDMFYASKKHI